MIGSDEVAGAAEKRGSEVYMEFKDSGSGMSDATMAKIFDPFLTTKFAGRGLGLAALVGILQGHRARLDMESIPGEGTTITVFPGSRANRSASGGASLIRSCARRQHSLVCGRRALTQETGQACVGKLRVFSLVS
jgi:hypothetical protein